MTPADPAPDSATERGTAQRASQRLPKGYLLAVAVLVASLVLLAMKRGVDEAVEPERHIDPSQHRLLPDHR